ncbi:transcription factor [Ganoderma sinense ZZ0214-1]|uniref:Transcription factor n=1 Tax=Ganoderma sinense ZZ0214-1 TaxID=1077348 RepID=A0A2G8RMF3_9APHY|nr:transcription factor [Ganoderma sinense ZZ0214-1]
MNMLSQNPEETPSVPEATSNITMDDSVQAIMDVIQGSTIPPSPYSEFLTSPMEDSPFEDFLTTPALGSADISADLLTSPAIFDADTFPDMGEGMLFGGRYDMLDSLKAGPPSFEDLYTMPSPSTPALDPTSLHPSPHPGTLLTPGTPARRPRKSLPTGTRRNLTPDSLVPVDAPIQPRKYVTPSATSRKEVPTAWLKKKRSRSQAFGEEDELEEDVSLNVGDMDAIEAKRRQNTLAARRSRKRKLEYQRDLEASVEREKEEKEMWKQRAMLYQALLESHGHEVPSFDTT